MFLKSAVMYGANSNGKSDIIQTTITSYVNPLIATLSHFLQFNNPSLKFYKHRGYPDWLSLLPNIFQQLITIKKEKP